jgi:hypothetical protein
VKTGHKIVLAILVLVVLNAIMHQSTPDSSPTPEQIAYRVAENNRYHSQSLCEYTITENLKAPSTAKFTNTGVSLGKGNYQVRNVVDAQNSFGAMLRNTFLCNVHCTGEEVCTVTKLRQQ